MGLIDEPVPGLAFGGMAQAVKLKVFACNNLSRAHPAGSADWQVQSSTGQRTYLLIFIRIAQYAITCEPPSLTRIDERQRW